MVDILNHFINLNVHSPPPPPPRALMFSLRHSPQRSCGWMLLGTWKYKFQQISIAPEIIEAFFYDKTWFLKIGLLRSIQGLFAINTPGFFSMSFWRLLHDQLWSLPWEIQRSRGRKQHKTFNCRLQRSAVLATSGNV